MMKPETPRYRSSGRNLFLTIGALILATCVGAVTAASSEQMDSTPQQVFDSMRGNFRAGQSKRRTRSLSMGLERPTRRAMVDRRG